MDHTTFAKRSPGAPPALALGTMNFGRRTSAVESEQIIARALERGIAVFDTANVYNDGEAERIVGRALEHAARRPAIATKVGLDRVDGAPEGLSRAAILRAIDASLARLRTDHVDVYYLHAPDAKTPLEETVDAMADVVRAGKARAWGVSNFASWQVLVLGTLAKDRGIDPPLVSQVIYNLLHRQIDVEYVAFARYAGLHTTVYNPLAGGLLTGRYRRDEAPAQGTRFEANPMYAGRYWTPAMFDRLAQLEQVARDERCTLVELAYAWVASRPGVDSVLLGPASVAQLDAALEAVGRTLSPPTLARIEALAHEWSGTDTNYVR